MATEECWLQVPGEPFIEASSLGNLRRIERKLEVAPRDAMGHSTGNFRPLVKGGPIRPWLNSTTGYLIASWRIGGKTKRCAVHRLVARTHVAGQFPGATVDHLDGNKTNNVATNFEWVTRAENTRRQVQAGRGAPLGEKHPSAKLKDAAIPELFRLRKIGFSLSRIGVMFGVSGSLVHKITSGKRRLHGLGTS